MTELLLSVAELSSVVVSTKNGWFGQYTSNYGLIAAGPSPERESVQT